MKITQGLVGVYALIGLIFGVYQHVGSTAHRLTATDFGTHIAHALLWPVFMFPSFGAYSDENRHQFQSNVGHYFQRKPCHLFRLNHSQSFHSKVGH